MAGQIRRLLKGLLTGLLVLAAASCSTSLPEPETTTGRHLEAPEVTPATADIPDIVTALPLVTNPENTPEPELYSIVAQDVPVRELLFAMSRDANINIDIHPDISGQVNINVINQSLPQILDRIARQSDIRWSFDSTGNLVVEPDMPFWRPYKIDYVNVERLSSTSVDVGSSIAQVGDNQSTGPQSNTSSATINLSSNNSFWLTLRSNLVTLLGEEPTETTSSVIVNPETGMLNIRADAKQHTEIASFLNNIQTRSLHQVLIEATVVEVELSDSYQAGVDWKALAQNSGNNISFAQNLTGSVNGLGNLFPAVPGSFNTPQTPGSFLTVESVNGQGIDISSTVSMLSEFGDLKVLSSPKIMTLNNQPALLRVVDNRVYFNIEADGGVISNGVATGTTITTNINTVPVGFVMTVTPQIGEDDQVTLNVRPTISRILGFVADPNPALASAGVESLIPEIQINEMESVLKVYNGQIAILGGLMQDSISKNTEGLPGLSRIPGLGNLFSYRDDKASKTELIVFIRPVVVRQPSIDGDLSAYRDYLPKSGQQ